MRSRDIARYAGIAALGVTVAGLVAMAQAQAPAPLKIGITEGFSGVYADLNLGEVEAAQMAIDDFGGKVLGRPIELLSADHQTKPDIGAQIARKWYDVDGVSMITGIGTSSVALAVRKIAQEKGKIASTPARPRPTSPVRPARKPARTGSMTPMRWLT